MKKNFLACVCLLFCVGALQAQEGLQDSNPAFSKGMPGAVAMPKPADELDVPPVTFHASEGDFVSVVANDWAYDPLSGLISIMGHLNLRTPLRTPGVILEPGRYRVGFNYQAGMCRQNVIDGVPTTLMYLDPFSIRMLDHDGVVDYEAGREVYRNPTACTGENTVVYDEFFLELKETDTVCFAIVPDTVLSADIPMYSNDTVRMGGFSLGFEFMSVEAMHDYDVAVTRVESDLTHISPVDQANAAHAFHTSVWNKGTESVNAVVSAYLVDAPDNVLGTSDPITIPADGREVIATEAVFSGLAAGYKGEVALRVDIEGQEDKNMENNFRYYSLSVSDSVMTFDTLTVDLLDDERTSNIGSQYNSISFGVLYTLVETDTLTSFTIGFGDGQYSLQRLSFYRWNEETEAVDYELFSTEYYRPDNTSGFLTFPCPHTLLEPGVYLIEVAQTSENTHAGVAADGQEDGILYVTSTASGRLNPQDNFGFAAMRLNFGPSHGQVFANDFALLSIDKPENTGLFAQNERVEATVVNRGTSSGTATVYCEVDGVLADSASISLQPNRRGTVSFFADLMATGMHTISLTLDLPGDQNSANDTLSKQVETLSDPDPYVMDFEYCGDFATTGFQPWMVTVQDQNNTIFINNWNIPNVGTNMGFMAVNPDQIGQSFAEWFPIRQGARFALTLADVDTAIMSTTANDAWLISPRLEMPESGAQLSFIAMSMMAEDDNGPAEESLNVMISTTNAQPASFGFLANYVIPAMNPDRSDPVYPWTRFTVDLSEYNGQSIYVAIQGQAQNYGFVIDDIRVGANAGNEAVDGQTGPAVSAYPNPVTETLNISASGVQIERVRLYSVSGALVYDSGSLATEVFRYNAESLAPGIYVARVTTAQGVSSVKIVVR